MTRERLIPRYNNISRPLEHPDVNAKEGVVRISEDAYVLEMLGYGAEPGRIRE